MKVVIDRKRWLRGEGSSTSKLLRSSDGKMCCLGFVCIQAGASETDIMDISSPISIVYGDCFIKKPIRQEVKEIIAEAFGMPISSHAPRWSDTVLSPLRWLMRYNDAYKLPEREEIIKEEMLKIGIEVEFIN